jgi:hypothetical protein
MTLYFEYTGYETYNVYNHRNSIDIIFDYIEHGNTMRILYMYTNNDDRIGTINLDSLTKKEYNMLFKMLFQE